MTQQKKAVAKKTATKTGQTKVVASKSSTQDSELKDLLALTDKVMLLMKEKPLVDENKKLRSKLDDVYAENLQLQLQLKSHETVSTPFVRQAEEKMMSAESVSEATIGSCISFSEETISNLVNEIERLTQSTYRATGKTVSIYQDIPQPLSDSGCLVDSLASINDRQTWILTKLREVNDIFYKQL
mgnify:CR=1 FL=1